VITLLLLIGIFLGLLVVLFVVVRHRHHLQEIEQRLDHAPVDNEEHLKAVMERENAATRAHVSSAVDAIQNDTKLTKQRMYDFVDEQRRDNSEFRGQLTIQKTRLKWVMGEIDL